MSKFNSLIQVEVRRVEDAANQCIERIEESRRRALVNEIRILYRREHCVYPLLVEWVAKLSGVKLSPIADGDDTHMLSWWEKNKNDFTGWDNTASDVWWTYHKHEEQKKRAKILLLAARNEPDKRAVMYLSTDDYEHLFS